MTSKGKQKKTPTRNRTSNVALDRKPIRLTRPLTTLSELFISQAEINTVFNIKSSNNVLSRFIELNRENLKFLGIEIEECYSSVNPGLLLRTSRYAGAIPLKSPQTSLYSVDMEVRGSYSPRLDDDSMYSLLRQIDAEILPEFHDSLQLVGDSLKPPVYLECEHFIQLYSDALKSNWTQFRKEIIIADTPRATTNWKQHALNSFNPKNALRFENHVNFQTADHRQWRQLNFVLHKAIRILQSSKTPVGARKRCAPLISKLIHEPRAQQTETVTKTQIKAVDPLIIKDLKKTANMILTDCSEVRRSWRIDISKLFETYVQYVFKKAAKTWQIKTNPHYSITGKRPPWSLAYLEPDVILRKGESQIIIDAKYKSHLLSSHLKEFNTLKESFRKDLHQVLAYSAFNPMAHKAIFMIYPIDEKATEKQNLKCLHYTQNLRSPFSSVSATVHLLGIPFGPEVIQEVIQEFRRIIDSIGAV